MRKPDKAFMALLDDDGMCIISLPSLWEDVVFTPLIPSTFASSNLMGSTSHPDREVIQDQSEELLSNGFGRP